MYRLILMLILISPYAFTKMPETDYKEPPRSYECKRAPKKDRNAPSIECVDRGHDEPTGVEMR